MSDGRDFRETDPYLRNRYGINNSKFPGWLKFAIPTLLLALTWTIWSGANHSNPENKFDLISFKSLSPKAMEIRFTVKFKSKDVAHQCSLVARDYQANIVGEKVEQFPIGLTRSEIVTTIVTRTEAVNAGVLGCQVR